MPAVLVAVIALRQCFFSPLHTVLVCPLLLSSTPFPHSSSLLSSAHITSFLPPLSPSPHWLAVDLSFYHFIHCYLIRHMDICIMRSNSLTAFKRHLTTIDHPSWLRSETLHHKPLFSTLLQPPLSSSTPSLQSCSHPSLFHPFFFFTSIFLYLLMPLLSFLPSDFLCVYTCIHYSQIQMYSLIGYWQYVTDRCTDPGSTAWCFDSQCYWQ